MVIDFWNAKNKAKQSQRCRLGDCSQRAHINMSAIYCRQLKENVVSASPRAFFSRLPSGDVCTGQTNQQEDHKLRYYYQYYSQYTYLN